MTLSSRKFAMQHEFVPPAGVSPEKMYVAIAIDLAGVVSRVHENQSVQLGAFLLWVSVTAEFRD